MHDPPLPDDDHCAAPEPSGASAAAHSAGPGSAYPDGAENPRGCCAGYLSARTLDSACCAEHSPAPVTETLRCVECRQRRTNSLNVAEDFPAKRMRPALAATFLARAH